MLGGRLTCVDCAEMKSSGMREMSDGGCGEDVAMRVQLAKRRSEYEVKRQWKLIWQWGYARQATF